MTETGEKRDDRPTKARCPMCARPSDEHYRPFCSKRCANIDLSRWLSGGYVIPGTSADTDGEDIEIPVARHEDDDETPGR
jgi:endogenous inhibitor of DNA gyrase (YacG/DUF329 family)